MLEMIDLATKGSLKILWPRMGDMRDGQNRSLNNHSCI